MWHIKLALMVLSVLPHFTDEQTEAKHDATICCGMQLNKTKGGVFHSDVL